MISLPQEFVSSAGGFGADPLTYRQIKRSNKLAVYERSRKGKIKDFEVVVITIEPKGKVQKFPNGTTKTIEDDTERYPGSSAWGRLGWSYHGQPSDGARLAALKKFDELLAKQDAIDTQPSNDGDGDDSPSNSVKPSVELKLPDGEFSAKELAEFNNVEYVTAFLFIKSGLETGIVKFSRAERRASRGRATNLYTKTS